MPDPAEYGYRFYPKERPTSPGHPRLDFVLRSKPTGRHFDPTHVRLPVVSRHGGIEMLTLYHPWRASRHQRLCAGRISSWDRVQKTVQAFSFGGKVEVTMEQDYTLCVLTSPAPILHLIHSNSPATLLAAEVEELLARRRAAWAERVKEFEERLAGIEPLQLYFMCLSELSERFEHLLWDPEDTLTLQLVQLIRAEIRAFQDAGEWPSTVPGLSEAL